MADAVLDGEILDLLRGTPHKEHLAAAGLNPGGFRKLQTSQIQLSSSVSPPLPINAGDDKADRRSVTFEDEVNSPA